MGARDGDRYKGALYGGIIWGQGIRTDIRGHYMGARDRDRYKGALYGGKG